MASSAPYTVRWGIMATGGIAMTFAKDLLVNPTSRDVYDVVHKVVAVASSTSVQRAADFIEKLGAGPGAKAYGSYAELVADPDVDIVYVATPHSHHFQNAMLALEAGKNVLCEKALTVTAEQARLLVREAEKRGLFFMEAVWTRYFPISIKLRELVRSGVIGTVYRVMADFSVNKSNDPDSTEIDLPTSNRLVNLDLAGGALLDLGVYSLTWLFQILYQCQPEADKERPVVTSVLHQYPLTGADETTTVLLTFPQHRTTGIALTSLRVATDPDGRSGGGVAVRIQGTGGEIEVMGPACMPRRYRIVRKADPGNVEVVDYPIPADKETGIGHGMFWEADEAARCLRDGKKQSETLPWDESILIMEVMEKVLADGGVKYPNLITSTVYERDGELNTGRS